MSSRREFIQKVALGSALISMPELAFSKSNESTLIHQVFFWLDEGQNVNEFMNEAKKLSAIKTVKKFYIGTPAPTETRDVIDASYSVACTLFFDSLEGEHSYQIDPLHLEFVEKNQNKWTRVLVYDFVV